MQDIRWNTSTYFSSLSDPELKKEFLDVETLLNELEVFFKEHNICAQDSAPALELAVPVFEKLLPRWNELWERLYRLSNYIYLFVSTDSRDAVGRAKDSELENLAVRRSLLDSKFDAWLGLFNEGELESRSELAKSHAHYLAMARTSHTHQLSPKEEELIALLAPSGSNAWNKLRETMTSQIMVDVQLASGPQHMPMTAVRALAKHEDARVRQAAYQSELEAWPSVSVPFAAAINSIKHRNTLLAKRQGWDSALDESVYWNGLNAKTLKAMQVAVVDSFPDFRRYFLAKAKLLGHAGALPFCDLFAPVGKSNRVWSYEEAQEFIVEQFGRYSAKMGGLAQRAFKENWIDVLPRPGKRDGAFCTRLWRDESRILLNFEPSFDSVSTLAHELGHAYHNLCDGGRTSAQRLRPMTLAETASIFCETVVSRAVIQESSDLERLHLIEMELMGHAQIVVDIHSRFLFESNLNAARENREQSVEELCEMMQQAQTETYGAGLSTFHPYMWAAKGHYYSSSFYNYPYTFGSLFALGLYAQYQKDPETFKANYDTLLSETGMADAVRLAKGFGLNIEEPDFWQSSLNLIRDSINEFVRDAAQL